MNTTFKPVGFDITEGDYQTLYGLNVVTTKKTIKEGEELDLMLNATIQPWINMSVVGNGTHKVVHGPAEFNFIPMGKAIKDYEAGDVVATLNFVYTSFVGHQVIRESEEDQQ